MLEPDQALHLALSDRHDGWRIGFAHSVYAATGNPTASGIGRCRPPFSNMDTAERQSLAESFELAAGKLEIGVGQLLVDEFLRTAIASQPTSGQWANEFNKIVQTAPSPDPIVYAKNLRNIANALKQ